jgi:membrane dipeptidase
MNDSPRLPIYLLAAMVLVVATLTAAASEEPPLPDQARRLAQGLLLVDTHMDVPYRIQSEWVDVTQRTADGNFDYERARIGGLDVPFMAIYTPAESAEETDNFALANTLIDRVEALAGRAPEKFMLVHSPAEALQAKERGLIGLAMGMENGSPLDGKLENVSFFKQRGISYITLAHSLSNELSDSSYDEQRPWNGLSPFGKKVIAEMNRLGVMIDVSHLSDDAFWQVMELSATPVIASHSSARHFTPGWERNLSDEMIRALAATGGVVQINFGSSFLTQEAQSWYQTMDDARDDFLESNGFDEHGEEAKAWGKRYREEHPLPFADLDDLMDHFTHVIGLAGVEHVGIGSDFDGVGDSLPAGMKDVSFYPNLVERLLTLGHSEADIKAILGGNLLRVWRANESFARRQVAGG